MSANHIRAHLHTEILRETCHEELNYDFLVQESLINIMTGCIINIISDLHGENTLKSIEYCP